MHRAGRQAIETLLRTYTEAVTTKNQALFETLLLNRWIPFPGVGQVARTGSADVSTRNSDSFRAGVLGGPAFRQSFRDVHILQDGPLVSSTRLRRQRLGLEEPAAPEGRRHWKIASEFYTGHAPSSR